MSDATAAAAKATTKTAKATLKAVESIPVSVSTTSTNVVVKLSKQYSIAVLGTAAITVAAVKLLELRKARKNAEFPDSI